MRVRRLGVMMVLKGKYNEAVIFTDQVADNAKEQIIRLLDNKAFEGAKIRIMPDVHFGVGCVIGFTMNVTDKVVPNLVGVDIGCGVYTVELKDERIDFASMDQVIYEVIPHGFKVHKSVDERRRKLGREIGIEDVSVSVDKDRAYRSIGTLGGGNHFIEVGKGDTGKHYLFIHSGSRHFGLQIAKAHQKIAQKKYPEQKDLAYLSGEDKTRYLKDMQIAQHYAKVNREEMAKVLIDKLHLKVNCTFDTVHNYISEDDWILRKGAVSAHKDEMLVIPLNMRDGVLIAKGKGNQEWNYTAPHGAGRLYGRKEAKKRFSMQRFEDAMRDVYSSSVRESTLDESPFAYKDADSVLRYIDDTVCIIDAVKPVYNFKA